MSVGGKAVRGVVWNNAASYIRTVVRFTGGIYLARTIAPEHFGEQGLAVAVLALAGSAYMVGQGPAIIRRQDAVRRCVATHLTIRIALVSLLGVGIAVVWVTGISPLSSQIEWFLLVLFLAEAPADIATIYIHYLQKRLLFKRLATINTVSVVGSMGLAIALAAGGYGVWALLWLVMAENLIKAVLSVVLVPDRIAPGFDRELAAEFYDFGKYVFATNVFRRSHERIDDITVGGLIGEAALGFYQRAWGLAGLLQQAVTGGVMAVSSPLFGEMREDRERLGRNFELLGSLLLRISVGGYVWMALLMPELVSVIYGDTWLPTVPLFRILLPYALVQSFNVVLRNAQFVAGDSALAARVQAIELAIMLILLFPLAVWLNAAGAAVAVDVSAICGTALFLRYLKPVADFSVRRIVLNPLLAGCGALLVFWAGEWSGLAGSGDLGRLFLYTPLLALSYLSILAGLEFRFLRDTSLRLVELARSTESA